MTSANDQKKGLFKLLDHVAILVRDTDEALIFYREQLGLALILSEELEDVGVRLTHLDAGNIKIQLVQPRTADHPLQQQLADRGEHIHHLCWGVDDTREAMARLPEHSLAAKIGEPHSAPRQGEAAFIDPSMTRGILMEMTGADE